MFGRNLVVCIDGTSNKFGRRNTNVVKLYRQIDLDTVKPGSHKPEQHAYYSSGIGTHAKNLPLLHRVEKVISDSFDMALAWNIEENVKDAYGWLARNYREGDRIYLFGFSRGAYQVRVLASLVHEVGLIRTPTEKQIEMAFGHYRSIHPHKPETREMAIEFKKTYCWWGVRIHFVGVWDTVSSVGLIKGDVFISTSASVTNASHFRHALALDECRVKFMPEYFQEMNAHRKNMLRPNADGDILEVWFAGCHADVGGVTRLGQPYHAGNVSLSWMRDEASEHGLILKPSSLTSTLEDVRSGRSNSLKFGWRLLEIMFPFRHQVSFSGVGKNKLKWHWFRPRCIIPGQRIHVSVWSGDSYRPRAVLGNCREIPVVLEGSFDRTVQHQPLETELSHGTMLAGPAMLLAWIQRYAAPELAVLLKSRLENPSERDEASWTEYIEDQSHFDKFLSITAYVLAFDSDIVIQGTDVATLIAEATRCLQPILSAQNSEHPDIVRVLSLLPLMTTNQTLREGIIGTHEVTSALVRVLGNATKSRDDTAVTLVADSICHILQLEEAELCNTMVDQLVTNGLAILLEMLRTNNPNHVLAALRMIVLLPLAHTKGALIRQELTELKCKVRNLARQGKGSIGLMAVSAFEVLHEPCNLGFSNILAYLGGSLMLDIEGDKDFDSSLASCGDRPPLSIDDFQENAQIIRKIIRATRSSNAGRRMSATITFLKLCRYQAVLQHLLREKIMHDFVDNLVWQLRRKETSLLAAYALMTGLKNGTWDSSGLVNERILPNIGSSITTMLERGWFDDAVGLVEGFEIFRQLMKHETLKEDIKQGIYKELKRKLENHEHDGIRTSLLCIDILDERVNPSPTSLVESDSPNSAIPVGTHDLEPTSLVIRLVDDSMKCLENEHWINQRKCIKVLSALSQTAVGEEAILSRIEEIVGMLLPESREEGTNMVTSGTLGDRAISPPIPPSQMLGPSYALYSLSRNETLRNKIRQSKGYNTLKGRYFSGSLVNGPDTPPWRVKTPNKSDVVVVIARMIKAVDEGFSYDGIGSIPEALPVVIRHLSGLNVLLRNIAVHALQLLPALAIGFVNTAISRADRFRRGTGDTSQGRVDGRGTMHSDSPASRQSVVTSPRQDEAPVFPTELQVAVAGRTIPPCSNNEQEHLNMPSNRIQETVTVDPVTLSITRSSSAIHGEPNDHHTHTPENNDDLIIEVPRESGGPAQAEIGPGLRDGRQSAVHASYSPFASTEHQEHNPEPPIVEQARTQETVAPSTSHTPSGLITFKEFIACDLPTKKYLKLFSPRARLRVHVGGQTFVSPTVKVGNQLVDGSKPRTQWQWDVPRPNSPGGEQFEIMIERRFLIKYTCIRHTAQRNTLKVKGERTGSYSALQLLRGPPNGQ